MAVPPPPPYPDKVMTFLFSCQPVPTEKERPFLVKPFFGGGGGGSAQNVSAPFENPRPLAMPPPPLEKS